MLDRVPFTRAGWVMGYGYFRSLFIGDGSPDYREKAGVVGSGPNRVITNQALLGFDKDTKCDPEGFFLKTKSVE
jgi:hypothetical protein